MCLQCLIAYEVCTVIDLQCMQLCHTMQSDTLLLINTVATTYETIFIWRFSITW